MELMPDAMLQSMGAAWRSNRPTREHLAALAATDA